MNRPIVELMCRNSRQPEWMRSDLLALISACRTAATRVCELCARFGPEVYAASTDVLLQRTRTAVSQIIEHHMTDEPSTFVDFVDDDGHGRGPFAVKCTLTKPSKNRLRFDWSGTSPQASSSINFFLSETMFKMFVGYYLLVVHAPYTIPNDGFHERRFPRSPRYRDPAGLAAEARPACSAVVPDALPGTHDGCHAGSVRTEELCIYDCGGVQR